MNMQALGAQIVGEVTTPKPSMAPVKVETSPFYKKKYGPLPLYGWGLVAVGLFAGYKILWKK